MQWKERFEQHQKRKAPFLYLVAAGLITRPKGFGCEETEEKDEDEIGSKLAEARELLRASQEDDAGDTRESLASVVATLGVVEEKLRGPCLR